MPFDPLMVYLQWVLPPFFCSVHSPLTFSFTIVWRLFSNNQRSSSTKNTTSSTATVTATAEGECRFNPLMAYVRWSFLTFLCSLHYPLTFILLLFGAYFLNLHYFCIKIFPSCVLTELYTTLQHNSRNNKEEGSCSLSYFV